MHAENLNVASKTEITDFLSQTLGSYLKLAPEQIDPQAPFLEMGASSLILVDSFRVLQEAFKVRPSMRRVFDEFNTIELLADYIVTLMVEREQAIQSGALAANDGPLGDGDEFPLTDAERQILFLTAYSEGARAAYMESALLKLSGPLDGAALEGALAQLSERHQALRTVIPAEGEVQRVQANATTRLSLIDFSRDTPEVQQAKVGAWLKEEARRPIDLSQQALRVHLLRLAEDAHLLALSGHSLLLDRSALNLILAELGALYAAASGHAAAELGEPLPFSAYLEQLAAYAGSPQHAADEAFWLAQVGPALPVVELPGDRPRPPVKSYGGARLVVKLDAELAEEVREFSKRSGVTAFMTYLAAFNLLLGRLSGTDDLAVGVLARAAGQVDLERLVANSTNPVVLHSRLPTEAGFDSYLKGVREQLLAMADHSEYPFASLVRALNPARDQSRSALFSVAFNLEPATRAAGFGALSAEAITPPIQFTRFDLELRLGEPEGDGAVQLICDYATDLFDAATIRRWMGHYKALLRTALRAPAEPLGQLPLLDAAERQQLLEGFNSNRSSHPADLTLHGMFEAQAARTPDAVATVDGETRLSYRELNERANRLAQLLLARGVAPDTVVGLFVDRTVEMVVAVLAVLKAGAAYLPLDPNYPKARLEFILEDANTQLVITQQRLLPLIEAVPGDRICLDSDGAALAQQGSDNLALAVRPEQAAYVIYTSGSTGKPKGVVIEHRNAANLVQWAHASYSAEELQAVLFSTSICFDISIFELFAPLSLGGEVVVVENALHLLQHPAAGEVTLINTVPSAMAELLRQGEVPASVRVVNMAGEVLHNALAQEVYRQTQAEKVYNLYGPTEATVYATWELIERGQESEPTIGRPVTNTLAYVLDEAMQPVPIGVAGELYLGGAGVARGYLNRPELDAEKFLADPFAEGGRLYRTGDLVRWSADGRIIYVGRADHMVKLRGFRIELGETEVALAKHAQVQETTVVVREDSPGDQRLVAYVVAADPTEEPTSVELQMFLKATLPDYMVPHTFVLLEALPRLPNGKVDRSALPAPSSARKVALGRSYDAPRNATEEVLAHIWAEILQLERVGVNDDFFELGGHSLLMTPLMIEIRKTFAIKMTMREFFALPTVAGVAAKIEQLSAAKAEAQAKAPTGDDDEADEFDQASEAVQERFRFLYQEAELDPEINAHGLSYQPVENPSKLFITGATGFVGSHLLAEILDSRPVQIFCLVRAANAAQGVERIRKGMETFSLWKEHYREQLIPVMGDLSKPGLGLSEEDRERIAQEADFIIHNGASVNFIYPYSALKAVNVDGTREVIRLAFHRRIKPVHFISTVAVLPMGAHRVFMEANSLDHRLNLNMAYDETKWVAEKMLTAARDRGLPVTVYRPGEVSGHSATGQCVPQHFIYAVLAGSMQLRAFPKANSMVDLTPVDYVAQAINHLAFRQESLGKTFHIVNPNPIHIDHLLDWFRSIGYRFDIKRLNAWRSQLMNDPAFTDNALYPYAAVLEDFHEVHLNFPVYDTRETLAALEGSGVECPPIDEQLMSTYQQFFVKVGFLEPPHVQ